jgi:CheY-like chemotaxis protein
VSGRRTILTVDRNARNLELLRQFLQKQGYPCVPVGSIEALDQIMSDVSEIGLAMIDISGFDSQIWLRCEQLAGFNIPFVVISPKSLDAIYQESLSHGARNVLKKPLVLRELLGLLENLLGD